MIRPSCVPETPSPAAVNGTTVTVTSTKDVAVEDGKIAIDGDEATTGTITVEFSKNDLAGIEPITKAFTVKVLPAAKSATIAAYDRNATSADEANNGDIAYSTSRCRTLTVRTPRTTRITVSSSHVRRRRRISTRTSTAMITAVSRIEPAPHGRRHLWRDFRAYQPRHRHR